MKILTIMVLACFTLNAFSLPTGDATRSAIRAKLNADQTKVSTATGQAYFDCNGIGIPNESTSTQAYSLACAELSMARTATPIAETAPTATTTTTTATYSSTSMTSVGVAPYSEPVSTTTAR